MKLLASFSLALSLIACGSLAHAQTKHAAAPAPAAAPQTPSYDFGDFKSVTLTGKAWKSLTDKDYDGVAAYTGKCIDSCPLVI